jgi:pyrroline-5-carboxylate reductase
MMSEFTLGFIGAGKMASALAQGFVRAGLVQPGHLVASDPLAPVRESFSKATGARALVSNTDVAAAADVLVLAVKPAQIEDVLREVYEQLTERHLVMSIAAGVTLAQMEAAVPPGTRVIRVMPNTPALVGASASAFALGTCATAEDAALAERLLSGVGVALQTKESLLDAVTGLSGSGPAYVFTIIEAMSDGGVAAGLPRDVATRLAAQTVLGAGKMVLETGLHPGVLKDMVASPGGTTIEGLHELEKAGVRGAMMNAVRASAEKARRMAQK